MNMLNILNIFHMLRSMLIGDMKVKFFKLTIIIIVIMNETLLIRLILIDFIIILLYLFVNLIW